MYLIIHKQFKLDVNLPNRREFLCLGYDQVEGDIVVAMVLWSPFGSPMTIYNEGKKKSEYYKVSDTVLFLNLKIKNIALGSYLRLAQVVGHMSV